MTLKEIMELFVAASKADDLITEYQDNHPNYSKRESRILSIDEEGVTLSWKVKVGEGYNQAYVTINELLTFHNERKAERERIIREEIARTVKIQNDEIALLRNLMARYPHIRE